MKITNKYGLPESVVRALSYDGYDYIPDAFSATSLIKPPRIRVLEKRHWDKIEEDVTERVWSLLGNAVHYILDKAAHVDTLNEERLVIDFEGTKVVGKPDLLVGTTIYDYKITTVWKYIYDIGPEWEQQLNIYRYLYTSYGFEIKKLKILAIFRDFVKSKTKDASYPEIPIHVFDIVMWPLAHTETFIRERIKLHKEAEQLKDDELPFCTDEERWKSPPKYAVMKGKNKRAIKLYDSIEEAEAHASTDKALWVQERPSIAKRCGEYCPVRDFCNQYQQEKQQIEEASDEN